MPTIKKSIISSLDSMKAVDIQAIDVSKLTTVTDFMIIATGTSNRHVQAIAQKLIEDIKHKHHKPIGIEGQQEGEWILIDFGDAVVHVMQPETREFYALEKLWSFKEHAH